MPGKKYYMNDAKDVLIELTQFNIIYMHPINEEKYKFAISGKFNLSDENAIYIDKFEIDFDAELALSEINKKLNNERT